jgi:hypothetical protein
MMVRENYPSFYSSPLLSGERKGEVGLEKSIMRRGIGWGLDAKKI